jgi:hypothetical protein
VPVTVIWCGSSVAEVKVAARVGAGARQSTTIALNANDLMARNLTPKVLISNVTKR